LNTRSAPAIAAAASVTGRMRGLSTAISFTPASRAGITPMSTDEGNGYRPPGA